MNLPRPIARLIFDYAEPWRLRPWLSEKEVANELLWANPRGLDLCERLGKEINWVWLSSNPHPRAMMLLRQNPTKIVLSRFITNPAITEADFTAIPGLE